MDSRRLSIEPLGGIRWRCGWEVAKQFVLEREKIRSEECFLSWAFAFLENLSELGDLGRPLIPEFSRKWLS